MVKSVKHLLSKIVQDSHLSPATCSTATVMSLRKILASVILKHVKSEMNQHEPDDYSHMLSLTTQQSRTVPSARNKNKHLSTSYTNLEEMSRLAVPKIFKSAPVKCTAFSTHLQLPARYPSLCLLASNPSKQSRW